MEENITQKNPDVDTKVKVGLPIKNKGLRSRIIALLTMSALVFSISSCEKYYEKTYEDYDLVTLKFDKETVFSNFNTYSIVDSIVFVTDTVYNGENGYPDFNIDMDGNTDGEYSKKILESVRNYFNALGLEEVSNLDANMPQLRVVVTSMTLKQVSRHIWFPNDYYGSWWGNGYWNNYYTWGVYSYHSSNNGSLAIDVFDLTKPIPLDLNVNRVNSVWQGNYEGLVGPTYEAYTNRVLQGIDEIFTNDTAFTK